MQPCSGDWRTPQHSVDHGEAYLHRHNMRNPSGFHANWYRTRVFLISEEFEHILMSYQVGTAIFSFIIAAHTFSLMFLRRQWPNRTSYITLIGSWAVLILDMCIGKLVVANGEAYYGIAENWCWIISARPLERWATEYLFIFASAGLSFILYFLVFLRLRGNITLSDGYRVQFHERPKVRVARTPAGAYIMSNDRRVESHLTTVGKQMLWHPIAYMVLVLPFVAVCFSSSSGTSVPFPVTAFVGAVFMLGGFVNVVLFCTTRSVLPEGWRQRLSIGTTSDGGRGVASLPIRRNSTKRHDGSSARMGVASPEMVPVVLDIRMQDDFGNEYDSGYRTPSSLTFSFPTPTPPPTLPTRPTRAHSGRQRAVTKKHRIRHLSFSPVQNKTPSLRSSGADGDGEDSDFSTGVRPVSRIKKIIEEGPAQLAHESKEQTGAPTPGSEDQASFHPFDAATLANTETRRSRIPSMLTFENAVHSMYATAHLSWASGDFRSSGIGFHWLGQRELSSEMQEMGEPSPTAVDRHPYSRPYLTPKQDPLLDIERGYQDP